MNSFRTMLTLTTVAALAVGASGCTTTDRAGGKAADPVTTLTLRAAQRRPTRRPSSRPGPTRSNRRRTARSRSSSRTAGGCGEDGLRDRHHRRREGRQGRPRVGRRARRSTASASPTSRPCSRRRWWTATTCRRRSSRRGSPSEMLAGVADAGVTGIGVLPGPMRKLLGVDKRLPSHPRTSEGKVVGMQDSALTERAMETLGADDAGHAERRQARGTSTPTSSSSPPSSATATSTRAGYVTGEPRPLAAPPGADRQPRRLRSAQRRPAIGILPGRRRTPIPAALDAAREEDAGRRGNLCRQGMVLTEASDDAARRAGPGLAAGVRRPGHRPGHGRLARPDPRPEGVRRRRAGRRQPARSDEPAGSGDDPVAGDYVATIDWPNVDVPDACEPRPARGSGHQRLRALAARRHRDHVRPDRRPGGAGRARRTTAPTACSATRSSSTTASR